MAKLAVPEKIMSMTHCAAPPCGFSSSASSEIRLFATGGGGVYHNSRYELTAVWCHTKTQQRYQTPLKEHFTY